MLLVASKEVRVGIKALFNPLNAELNLICHLLALVGAHHILHVSRIRVKLLFQTNSASCTLHEGLVSHALLCHNVQYAVM